MTHILFVTSYYPPEKGAAAVCVSETARRLVLLGHEVTVLTSVPNYPDGIVPPEYRGRLVHCEVRDGVRVVYVWSYVSPNKGFFCRILAQLSFGCLAPLLGWRAVGRPDLMIVGSPPLFNAIAGRMLSWLKRCPFIFMVADLWPESAVQLGILRSRLFIRFSEWLEWSTYRRAQLIWVVTEGIRTHLLKRGLAPERVFLLTNGVDCTKFRPFSQAEARAELGWEERFTVLYAGTHGLVHGLATLLQAAELMQEHEGIHFVLVGDGAEKASLMAQAQQRNLTNITFLDPQPHERMPVLLAAADVCLASTRKVALFEGMLPIKMYEAMACARPLVLAMEGEACRLAAKGAGAAIHVEPENAGQLVSAILYLYEHPEEAAIMGERGRAIVTAHFDYDELTAILNTRIALLLGKRNFISTTTGNIARGV